MEFLSLPTKPKEWTLELLEQLIKYVDIESETFDFKKEPNKLYEDICAIANTKGGFLVLGISEKRSKDKKRIIGFHKVGFKDGKQDNIRNEIGNNVVNVEPQPLVDIEHLKDEKTKRFFTVIRIDGKTTEKPYFVKGTDQCFVRIQNSSRRVGRITILNLYSANFEQQKNLENLRTACGLVKESFRHILREIHSVEPKSTMKIPLLDLTFLRNAVLSCEWFLKENNLWGEHTSQSSYTHGINSLLHDLDLLNIYIKSYDDSHDTFERGSLRSQLMSFSLGSSYEQHTLKMLDTIIFEINKFLNNK